MGNCESLTEGVGVVRTIDPIKGLISIISTYDFKDFMKDIIVDSGKNCKGRYFRRGPWFTNYKEEKLKD